MTIRKAVKQDMDAVAALYDKIHTAEENGKIHTGWIRSVYPTVNTVSAALDRDDLFLMVADSALVATGIINQIQVDAYERVVWKCPATNDQIMVMHTLAVDPEQFGRGYGTRFVRFYEEYARQNGCRVLRMDTNEKNREARRFYQKLGFCEVGTVPCEFNGMTGVHLVMLEKVLK